MNPILARLNGDAYLHGVCFGPAIPVIMVGAVLASSAITAYSMYSQGQQQSAADAYNAQVAQQTATTANEVAASQAEQQDWQKKQTMGEALADAAVSGVDPNSGSPLNVMSNVATEGELQKQTTLWQGQYNANSYLQQSALQSFYGANAAQAGITGAAGTLLSGAGSIATKFYTPAASTGTPTAPAATISAPPKF